MTAPTERKIGREITSAMHNSTGAYELIIGAIAAGAFGGLIDWAVGTFPLFMVIFFVLGFFGASAGIYYRYKAAMEAASSTRATRDGELADLTGDTA